MVLVSVSRSGGTLSWPPALLPDWSTVTIAPYRYLLTETFAPSWLWNSAVVAVLSTALTILISTPAGYALSRATGPERTGLGHAILFSKMIPATLLLAPLYIMFNGLGILNSIGAVVLAKTSYTVPFATWMMKSYIDGIPRELEEAALIDAAIRRLPPFCV
jgi:multiple sugar transport system permease protein